MVPQMALMSHGRVGEPENPLTHVPCTFEVPAGTGDHVASPWVTCVQYRSTHSQHTPA